MCGKFTSVKNIIGVVERKTDVELQNMYLGCVHKKVYHLNVYECTA